jgi:hypothetical protein
MTQTVTQGKNMIILAVALVFIIAGVLFFVLKKSDKSDMRGINEIEKYSAIVASLQPKQSWKLESRSISAENLLEVVYITDSSTEENYAYVYQQITGQNLPILKKDDSFNYFVTSKKGDVLFRVQTKNVSEGGRMILGNQVRYIFEFDPTNHPMGSTYVK